MSVRINIAGDFCVTPSYTDKELLSASIREVYNHADINIVNLECPVNKHGDKHKIVKHGPHLQTTDEIFSLLKQLNVTAVTLANNHILDYGTEGLASTIEGCKKNNIQYVGVGDNLKEAGRYLIIEKNDLKIAIINFCENEWSIATDETAGASPLDIIDNSKQIQKAKASADIVLVIVHGGNEYYNLPSPRMVKQYRYFAELGASAVISHHTHCVSGYEIYNGVPIFYGLGNILFTKHSEQPGWFKGLTVQLIVEKGQPVKFNLVPTEQTINNYVLTALNGDDKKTALKEIEECNSIITDEKKLAAAWNELIEKRSAQYLYNFSAVPAMPGKYVRSGLRRFGFVNKLLPKKYLTGVINYISCEAHLDVATAVLKKKLFKK